MVFCICGTKLGAAIQGIHNKMMVSTGPLINLKESYHKLSSVEPNLFI